ncbi:MAG: histidinol-phosphate transaminase [Rhodocyclaceae bacterium]|nr:histidinol-phosphate transaminase [Rhodocyclaceae bacterium]
MSRYWSAVVHGLTPYVPGEQPKVDGLVKLNTNECPYPPSPRVVDAIRDEIGTDGARLRLYPDPESDGLKAAIADRHRLQPAEVFVGNGSDEVLAHIFMGLLDHPRPILFPDVTYSFYPVYCALYGIAYREVALTAEFEIRPEDYLDSNGGIIFPNPNAPTGRLLDLDAIERIVAGNPGSVVVIDEAYVDFGGRSAATLVPDHENLVVVHTLSKSRSLAGIRVGYALAQAPLIEALQRVKNSFNSYPLDRLAQRAATAALDDEDWFRQCCERIVATRQRTGKALAGLGFEVLPSAANFVFARHPGHSGASLAAGLRARRVVVRHFAQPRIEDFLRITIGTDEECDALLAALGDMGIG